MMVAVKVDCLSPEEYIALEEKSSVKHEYIDGQIYAMSGTTTPHNIIIGNLFPLLKNHLRGKGCRVFFTDVKAQIDSCNCYYYPDVMVTCDPRDRELLQFQRYPCLIVKVLSDSTEAFDRGDKFADYRQLESLQEYVLISQKRQQVEVFRRNAEGLWVLHSFGAGDTVDLACVDFRVEIAELYEDVDLGNPIASARSSAILLSGNSLRYDRGSSYFSGNHKSAATDSNQHSIQLAMLRSRLGN